jgi:L-fucose isomerase-like protein
MGTNTFGLIIGNRGFFPAVLARDGREEMLKVLEQQGYKAICLTPEQSKFGAVETLAEAQACADLFKKHRDEIDGIIVSLPNFGDERGVANSIRLAGLNVPVLVQAYPDETGKMLMGSRRDSFCGKISVTNNLWQYGIKFTLTSNHTVAPTSDAFKADLASFAATCRIVKGLRGARIGALGARPTAFNTVRYSEKLLENSGISVETLDLSEVFGRIARLKDDDPQVKDRLAGISSYVSTQGIPDASLLKMAKFGVVVDEWMAANQLVGTSIQCWTSMEEFFGVVPCTLMSMMSNKLLPSACEVDMVGMVAMYILQLAAGEPSAIVDWNNNYGEDPDKCVIFHCSNLPKHFFESHKMDFQEIIAGSVGKDNTFGTIVGQLKPGPLTFCRVSTDDLKGKIRAYCGQGEIVADKFPSFGGYGAIHVPGLQKLLQHLCKHGYEHHVSVNRSHHGQAVYEALSNYMGWDVYHHGA